MPQQTRDRPPLHFDRLLIEDRWERDVRMEIGGDGRIAVLSPGGSGEGCERVAGWAVPGVPNVHSHSFQRAMAGLAEGRGPDSFWSWRDVMYAFVDRLTPDDVEAITAQVYVEMLKSGFTCVGEFHYLHHAPGGPGYDDPAEMSLRIVAAARATGIGLVHMPVVYEAGGFGGDALGGGQRRFRMDLEGAAGLHEALRAASLEPGIRLGWALHSLRAVSRETVGRLDDFVAGVAPVHIHIAEQELEVRDCLAHRRARPVEWLLDHASVDSRWCLVHATHVTDGEMDGIAASGAVVGLCPTTEANLGDGLFPLGAFVGRGGHFGIGTDSHVSRSPVEELRLLDYGQRLVSRSRSVLGAPPDSAGGVETARSAVRDAGGRRVGDPSDAGERRGVALSGAGGALLAHASRDGCGALGWNAGRIEAGARADLVVLDEEHPALLGRGEETVLDSWVFSGTETPVRHVMVGGRWVVRDGYHGREEEVKEAFARVVKRYSGIA